MTQSLLTMAKELVLAQIQAGQSTPGNINMLLKSAYDSLAQLHDGEEVRSGALEGSVPVIDWKQSITPYSVQCLECGATFKQMSRKHLAHHELDMQSYRAKYRIPLTQSLVARETQRRRRKVAKQVKPWEKTRQARKTQSRKAT